MIAITEQIIIGVAFWFAVALIMLPFVGFLWGFVKQAFELLQAFIRK
jgi:hypothetical protein